jgi:hypothetical protein
MEKMQSENQMRDQVIKELQEKLEQSGQPESHARKNHESTDDKDQVNKARQQLQVKEEEIKKLEGTQ